MTDRGNKPSVDLLCPCPAVAKLDVDPEAEAAGQACRIERYGPVDFLWTIGGRSWWCWNEDGRARTPGGALVRDEPDGDGTGSGFMTESGADDRREE